MLEEQTFMKTRISILEDDLETQTSKHAASELQHRAKLTASEQVLSSVEEASQNWVSA